MALCWSELPDEEKMLLVEAEAEEQEQILEEATELKKRNTELEYDISI